MDGRLVAYVRRAWAELVAQARVLCPDADLATAQDLVLSTLTRVGARWRLVPDKDALDGYVRQSLVASCARHDRRSTKEPSDVLLMDVVRADIRTSVPQIVADESADEPAEMTPDEALAAVVGRLGQVRRRRMVAAAVAVVVVGAVALSLPGSGNGTAHPVAKHVAKHQVTRVVPTLRAFPEPLTNFASGVTAGGGFIWTIESHATIRGSVANVVERDPVTGKVQARFAVPQSDDHIAYGFGEAWTWHDSDDFPSTVIATVNSLGDSTTMRSTPPLAIHDVAFTRTAAWLTEPKANVVLSEAHGVLGAGSQLTVAGAKFVVPLNASTVLVAGRTGTLHELPSGRPVLAGKTSPTLLDPASSGGFWLGFGRRVSYQAAVGLPKTVRLTLPLTVAAVVGDPADGVYFALRSDDPFDHDPYLVYYSPDALAAAEPQPTAHLDGLTQAEDLTLDPAGGVVFVTNNGTVEAWRPSGLVGNGQQAPPGLTTLG